MKKQDKFIITYAISIPIGDLHLTQIIEDETSIDLLYEEAEELIYWIKSGKIDIGIESIERIK